jgi:hypothetical protein
MPKDIKPCRHGPLRTARRCATTWPRTSGWRGLFRGRNVAKSSAFNPYPLHKFRGREGKGQIN